MAVSLSKAEVEAYLASVDLHSCLEGALNAAVAAKATDPPAFFRDYFTKLAGGNQGSTSDTPRLAATPRSLEDTPRSMLPDAESVDIIGIATRVFQILGDLSTGTVPQEDMKAKLTELSKNFATNIKYDVFIEDVHGKGPFVELMSALAPIWDGLTITKAKIIDVKKRLDTVAIVHTMYTAHIVDGEGNVIEGTDGEMEVAVSVRFRGEKIAQWYQEFDKEILLGKRAKAKAALEARAAAAVEAAVEAPVEDAAEEAATNGEAADHEEGEAAAEAAAVEA